MKNTGRMWRQKENNSEIKTFRQATTITKKEEENLTENEKKNHTQTFKIA